MSTAEAKKIVKDFGMCLKQHDFPFSAIYLYGSFARGNPHKWSDIDVAVVSPKFSGKKWEEWDENEQQMWRLRRNLDMRLEPLGFSPEEFEKESSMIVREIKKHGVKIA